uniref:F-box associated domain-containing protein n=1 Tax=Arundo donax TaxID=35708 RepID=A0A0A9DLV4_ARUDO
MLTPPELSGRDYAHGCFCWVMPARNKLLVLDTRMMKFSSVDIAPAHKRLRRAIVEAGEGRFGMFTLCFDMEQGAYDLSYTILRNDGQDAHQWQLEAMIRLPLNYDYNILGVAGGYLLLIGFPQGYHLVPISERPNRDCFSLNLKTFQIEWFCATRCLIQYAPLYAGFPPSLSPPTI